MRSNKWPYFYLLLSSFFSQQANSLEPQKVEFSIKPIACIVKKSGDTCTMTVKVHWQTILPITPCLYQDEEKTFCWQSKNQAMTKVAINIKENMMFTLRDDDSNIYAQQEIIINTSSSRKYRRRLRSSWSLF